MLPTIEEYRSGAHTWRFEKNGTTYNVGHHGWSDFMPSGIWTFYVYFKEEFFQSAEDWALFDLPNQIHEFYGTTREDFPYDDIPEFSWHGGPTYGKRGDYLGRDGKRWNYVKIGCDYGHLWDREGGFPDDLASVRRDAERVVDELHKRFPQNLICSWSGKVAHPSEFYTARNKATVHRDSQVNASATSPFWLPAEGEAA